MGTTKKAFSYMSALALLTLLVTACNKETSMEPAGTLNEQESNQEAIASQPDASEITDDVTAEYYGPKNPYTGSILADLTSRGYVQAEINRFTPDGFEYESLHSFVLEGEFDSLGIDARITIIALEYKLAPMERVIYLRHLEIDGTPVGVAAEEVVFSEISPGPEFEMVAEGVWGRNLPSPAASAMVIADVASYRTPGAPSWSWSDWGECSANQALATCTGVVVGCAFSGPGYLGCVGGGCAAGAVTGMITCALDQWF